MFTEVHELHTLTHRGAGGGGGGQAARGRLQYEMPGCVCWGSESVPIMKDTFGQKTYIEGPLYT